jgi:hypothetical protein
MKIHCYTYNNTKVLIYQKKNKDTVLNLTQAPRRQHARFARGGALGLAASGVI